MEWLLFSWPTLILLGLSLRMALRLTYGARGPEPGDPVFIFLNITGWVLIGLGLAPAILGGIFTFFGLIIVLLAAATLLEAVIGRRAAQRRSMCRMLSLLVGRGAQLESSVLLMGQSMRGIVGRAARKLFAALQGGTPLAAAIVRHPAALPAEARAYLAVGQTSTAHFAALRELSRSDRDELASIWRACVDRIAYLAAVLLMLAVLLTFVLVKIVPEFEQIFAEFMVELPAITRLAIGLSDFVVNYLAVPLFLAGILAILAAFIIGICYLCDMPVLTRFTDRMFRGRRTADVLRILALATQQRQPLTEVLHRVALVYPTTTIRGRLLAAAEMVDAGADWRDALLQTRAITRAEHGLLNTAERVGNLPWALRAVAERREKRAVYRLAAALQVVYPLAILLLGAFVGFYVVSLFVPIVELIHGLT